MSPLLPFPQGCVPGRLVRREKRFFVVVRIGSGAGHEHLAHTNNTGSMLGLLRPGAPVWLSPASNPARKLPWTLEMVWCGGEDNCDLPLPRRDAAHLPPGPTGRGFWVGVNTRTPNLLLEAAFHAGQIPWTAGYTRLLREQTFGESRLDARLDAPGSPVMPGTPGAPGTPGTPCTPSAPRTSGAVTTAPLAATERRALLPPLWIECKNVTLVEDDTALFPDAVSARAAKHLDTLMQLIDRGQKALNFYLVQRPDGHCFGPAQVVDAAYAARWHTARAYGVDMRAHRALLSVEGIDLGPELPLAREN